MKSIPAVIFLSLIGILLFSCKKSNTPAPVPTIVHNWSVVSDSVYYGSNGTKYAGKYFNFTPGGEVDFSTDYLTIGTIKYQLTSDTTIMIAQPAGNGLLETIGNGSLDGYWHIDKLTDHTLTIQSWWTVPEDGKIGEIIKLSR